MSSESAPTYSDQYKYAGYLSDAVVGLLHANARDLNPADQIWMEEDPLGFDAGDMNLRRYVGDGPTDGTDPSGMEQPGGTTEEQKIREALQSYHRPTCMTCHGGLLMGTRRYEDLTAAEKNDVARWNQGGYLPPITVQDVIHAAEETWSDIKQWWVKGDKFLTGPEGDKLFSKGVLSNADLGKPNYYLLNVESQRLLLRKYLGNYYLVSKGANSPNYNNQELIRDYDRNWTLRALNWAETGLTITLHMLPLGQSAELLMQGKFKEAGEAAVMDGLLWGAGPLGKGFAALKRAGLARNSFGMVVAARGGAAALTAWHAVNTTKSVADIVQAIRSGNYTVAEIAGYGFNAVMHLQGFRSNLSTALNCFAAGTPVLTPNGPRPIESLQEGDLVLSQPEGEPDGAIDRRCVERVYVRSAVLLHLHVGEQVIRVTGEHPFYVKGKGWVEAGLLEPGDLLLSHEKVWIPVQEIIDGGSQETVYNLRVSEYHTYFVGEASWGFSVWVHNASPSYDAVRGILEKLRSQRVPLTEAEKQTIANLTEEEVAQFAQGSAPQSRIPGASDAEHRMDQYLRSQGRRVEGNPLEGAAGAGRQGDRIIDGVKAELKSLDPGATSNTIRNVVNNSIRRGGQARTIIIDARGSGLTQEEAARGIGRAMGISRGKVDQIRVIGDGFDITN